jgi:hypothetical protein
MFRSCLHKIMGLIFIGLIFSLIGCVTLATDHRKEGFDIIQKGFASLKETPDLHEVMKIGGITIHIVGSRNQFDWNIAAAYGSPVVGYANTKNEIWIYGKVINGKIVINQAVLGHELTHLLNFINPKIANPDLLDELGA